MTAKRAPNKRRKATKWPWGDDDPGACSGCGSLNACQGECLREKRASNKKPNLRKTCGEPLKVLDLYVAECSLPKKHSGCHSKLIYWTTIRLKMREKK